MLEHHLNRLSWAKMPRVVATTKKDRDSSIVELCNNLDTSLFRGSESDVLKRFLSCARKFGFNPIIRVTSDCPLIDGNLIHRGLERFRQHDTQYLSNTIDRTFPRGFDFEILSLDTLKRLDSLANDPSDREHVTRYLRLNQNMFRTNQIKFERDVSHFRLTVDERQDLKLLRRLINHYNCHERSCAEIISLLQSEPDLAGTNESVQQKKID